MADLGAIEHALAKLARGQYGLCEETDEPIGYARLRAQPWARYAITVQESVERSERARRPRR
ncbi:MAG: TraR/DksA C4-type zinc finger protein [Sandaracinaceae bacterium]|nr:TraR/DksA C4-type zinc finger protein [Sandaracinaceae bacterium]